MPSKDQQAHFDFILPYGQQWFSPSELSRYLPVSENTIRAAFDNQKILGHSFNGRALRGKEQRQARFIHREAAILLLCETANYEPNDVTTRHIEALKNRSVSQLMEIRSGINQLISLKQKGQL